MRHEKSDNLSIGRDFSDIRDQSLSSISPSPGVVNFAAKKINTGLKFPYHHYKSHDQETPHDGRHWFLVVVQAIPPLLFHLSHFHHFSLQGLSTNLLMVFSFAKFSEVVCRLVFFGLMKCRNEGYRQFKRDR